MSLKLWKSRLVIKRLEWLSKMEKKTLVVNLIAPPSAGKSTMAANIFAELKWMGIDCELVSEFAKELVWEQRNETFEDELYIFAKQNHRLFRVNGKVDVIITDRPIILSVFYNNKYGDKSSEFQELVLHEHNKYENLNFYINRKKAYNPNGRNQTEEESNQFGLEILNMLYEVGINCEAIDGNKDGVKYIVEQIVKNIGGN